MGYRVTITNISIETSVSCLHTVKCKIIILQIFLFSLSTVKMSNNSIWLIDKTLSRATTQSQSGAGRDDNEGVFRISESFIITRASASDCLMLYQEHSFESGPTHLQRCIRYILQSQSTEPSSLRSTAPPNIVEWHNHDKIKNGGWGFYERPKKKSFNISTRQINRTLGIP